MENKSLLDRKNKRPSSIHKDSIKQREGSWNEYIADIYSESNNTGNKIVINYKNSGLTINGKDKIYNIDKVVLDVSEDWDPMLIGSDAKVKSGKHLSISRNKSSKYNQLQLLLDRITFYVGNKVCEVVDFKKNTDNFFDSYYSLFVNINKNSHRYTIALPYIDCNVNFPDEMKTPYIADKYVYDSIQVGNNIKEKLEPVIRNKRAKYLYEIFINNKIDKEPNENEEINNWMF